MVQPVQTFENIVPSFLDMVKTGIREISSQQGSVCCLEKKCRELVQSVMDACHFQPFQINEESSFRDLTEMVRTMTLPDSIQEPLQAIQTVFERVQACLNGKERRITLEKRWISLGLPVEVLEGSWSCVETIFASGMAYSLSAFLKLHPDRNCIRFNRDIQDVEVLFEGAFMPWKAFESTYMWSKKQDSFIDKGNKEQEITFTDAPVGFIRKSRYTYDEPFPTTTLDAAQLRSVKQQATLFTGAQELPHAVVQVFTSPGGFSGPDWLCNAFAQTGSVPSHCGIRVISNTGDVYTFGYMMDPKEETTWASPFRLASTVKASIGMIDYDEFRRFGKRFVTSLPLTEDAYKKVMAYLGSKQKANDSVFNFGRDNCASFSASVLHEAGYSLPDLHVSVSRFFGGLLIAPIMHLPVVGKVLKAVGGIFASFFSGIRTVGSTFFPSKLACPILGPVTYLADKVLAVVKWCFSWVLGATKMSPYVTKTVGDRVTPFLSVGDLFRIGATDMVSSEGLLAWMQQQRSTKEYVYRGPELTVL